MQSADRRMTSLPLCIFVQSGCSNPHWFACFPAEQPSQPENQIGAAPPGKTNTSARKANASDGTINESPDSSKSTSTAFRNISSLIFPKSRKPSHGPATMNGTPNPYSVSVSAVMLPATAWDIEMTTNATNSTG